jgi:hypothetical protein
MTTSEARAERLRALTAELRASVVEVRRASQAEAAAERTAADRRGERDDDEQPMTIVKK